MGRSFDRGGQSRKEKMRSKRRAFQQAERDREMRDAVMQARRTEMKAVRATAKVALVAGAVAHQSQSVAQPAVTAIIDQKRQGFLSRVFGRIFGKAA
jgi:hypothetical protein